MGASVNKFMNIAMDISTNFSDAPYAYVMDINSSVCWRQCFWIQLLSNKFTRVYRMTQA